MVFQVTPSPPPTPVLTGPRARILRNDTTLCSLLHVASIMSAGRNIFHKNDNQARIELSICTLAGGHFQANHLKLKKPLFLCCLENCKCGNMFSPLVSNPLVPQLISPLSWHGVSWDPMIVCVCVCVFSVCSLYFS